MGLHCEKAPLRKAYVRVDTTRVLEECLKSSNHADRWLAYRTRNRNNQNGPDNQQVEDIFGWRRRILTYSFASESVGWICGGSGIDNGDILRRLDIGCASRRGGETEFRKPTAERAAGAGSLRPPCR